jgi:ankyrin repeat protein
LFLVLSALSLFYFRTELINSGVKASAADYDHRTALHLAAAEGHLDVIKFLVQQGADVNSLDRFGNAPLDEAILHGNDEEAEFLRSVNANVGMAAKPLLLVFQLTWLCIFLFRFQGPL